MIITAGTVTSAKSAVASMLTSADAAAHSAAVDAAGHGDLLRAGAYCKCVCSVRSNIRSAYYYVSGTFQIIQRTLYRAR